MSDRMDIVSGEKEKMRLTDADALKEHIANNVYPVQDYFNSRDYGMFWTGGIEKAIEDAPTVDAVEVVRCKDCKWYERKYPWNGHVYECSYLEYPMDDNDYCSLGERREDGKTN